MTATQSEQHISYFLQLLTLICPIDRKFLDLQEDNNFNNNENHFFIVWEVT